MFRNKLFVWFSSTASRKNLSLSALAGLETLIAIGLYWLVIPSWTGNYTLALASLIIVPFLLLRSKKSVQTGVEWYSSDFLDMSNYSYWPTYKYNLLITISFVIDLITAVLVIYLLSDFFVQYKNITILYNYNDNINCSLTANVHIFNSSCGCYCGST